MKKCMTTLTALISLAILSLGCAPELEEETTSVESGLEQGDLELVINDYRVANELEPIPYSEALSLVAQTHVDDLEANYPYEPCNLHSWSNSEHWTSCCYSAENPDPQCMWNKPREMTSYQGEGFEIAVSLFGPEPITAARALELWRASDPHHEVILNQNDWESTQWQAMGVAVSEHYAVVWFGKVPDLQSRAPRVSENVPVAAH